MTLSDYLERAELINRAIHCEKTGHFIQASILWRRSGNKKYSNICEELAVQQLAKQLKQYK